MKKVLLSLSILLSSLAYSQDFNAEIHYNDGRIKKGLVDNIERIRVASTIRYRENSKAKKKTLDLQSVKKIVYIDNNTIAERINFKKRRNFWGIIYKEVGNLKIHRNIMIVNPKFDRGMFLPGFTQIDYFGTYKDEPAIGIFMDTNGIGLKVGNKKLLKKYFKDICPKLVENIDEIEYKEHFPDPYIDYFEKHCK